MINQLQLKERIIIPALISINMYTSAATRLLMLTAATESGLGSYMLQFPNGPALGIFQMEPATYEDVWNSVLDFNPQKKAITLEAAQYEDRPDCDCLIWDMRLATIMCRMHYSRFIEPLPAANDDEGMISYYYKYWGPNPEKTSKQEALERARKYLKETK